MQRHCGIIKACRSERRGGELRAVFCRPWTSDLVHTNFYNTIYSDGNALTSSRIVIICGAQSCNNDLRHGYNGLFLQRLPDKL